MGFPTPCVDLNETGTATPNQCLVDLVPGPIAPVSDPKAPLATWVRRASP